MIKDRICGNRGFTLVELLIVMGMFAGVMAAVYTVYSVQMRSAYTQDDVVEVQQNLRIGMDEMTRDLRSAGLLIPNASMAIGAPLYANQAGLGNTDAIAINTASASERYAMINQDITSSGTTSFAVASAESVDKFVNTSTSVRIISASTRSEPSAGVFTIANGGLQRATSTMIITGMPGAIVYKKGDMIVGTAVARPETVQYCVGPNPGAGCGAVGSCPLNQTCLYRIENAGTASAVTNAVATNITDLQFRYLLQNLTEVDDVPANPRLIRAVRVTLTGQTVASNGLSGAPKQRQLTSVIKIRN